VETANATGVMLVKDWVANTGNKIYNIFRKLLKSSPTKKKEEINGPMNIKTITTKIPNNEEMIKIFLNNCLNLK